MVDSWFLKLHRANEHLQDIKRRIAAMSGDPDPRLFRVEKEYKAGGWLYSFHSDMATDEMLPVIIGEFLFNLRSALDHIAAANVPVSRREKSQFPIFTQDFRATGTSPAHTQRLKGHLRRWNEYTEGMKAPVLTLIEWAQPYHAPTRQSSPAENDALAILHSFQNADKHQELNVIVNGISQAVAEIESEGKTFDFAAEIGNAAGMLRDGAVFLRWERDVDVKLRGTPKVAMTRGPELPHREIPISLEDLFLEVSMLISAISRVM